MLGRVVHDILPQSNAILASSRRSPRENDDEWLLVMIGDEDDAMTCVVVTADASSSVVLHWVNVSNGDDVRPSERIPVVWPSRERSRLVDVERSERALG